jgi:exodeoxyribonuclease-3
LANHAWHHPGGARHAFLELSFRDTRARIFGLHLRAWFSKWSERRRTMEISALLSAIKDHQNGPHLIVGDFNALEPGARLEVGRMPHWIRAMVWLSGRDIARSTIQVMLDARYADAWRRLNPEGGGYTFPVWDPHVRLDYAFVPDRDVERIIACDIVHGAPRVAQASDHYPLLVELDV